MDCQPYSNVTFISFRLWLKVHALADHMVPKNRCTMTIRWRKMRISLFWKVSFCCPQVFSKWRNHRFRRKERDEQGENAAGGMHSMGTIPLVCVLQTGAQCWCLTSSLIPLQQRHTNQCEHISSIFFCLFVYLLWTVATVWADIQWWICVIRFQLLICIESVPPGDINQQRVQLSERMLVARHCHRAAVMGHFSLCS